MSVADMAQAWLGVSVAATRPAAPRLLARCTIIRQNGPHLVVLEVLHWLLTSCPKFGCSCTLTQLTSGHRLTGSICHAAMSSKDAPYLEACVVQYLIIQLPSYCKHRLVPFRSPFDIIPGISH
jgi:hypothetical protein